MQLSELKGGTLKGARRLQVTRDGVRKDRDYVVLDFEEEELPINKCLNKCINK